MFRVQMQELKGHIIDVIRMDNANKCDCVQKEINNFLSIKKATIGLGLKWMNDNE